MFYEWGNAFNMFVRAQGCYNEKHFVYKTPPQGGFNEWDDCLELNGSQDETLQDVSTVRGRHLCTF